MSLKNITVGLVIKKNDKVVFGDLTDKIKIDMTDICFLSKTMSQIIKQLGSEDIVGKTVSINYKKKDVSKDRRAEKLINENLKITLSSGDFIFYGHEFKKIMYVAGIRDNFLIVNDKSPFNEDDFKVSIKILEMEHNQNNSTKAMKE